MATSAPQISWIRLDGAVNAREVVPGVLVRADNLQALSDADIRTLVEGHGVEVVVDLRTDTERRGEGAAPLDSDPRVRVEARSLYPETGGNTDVDGGKVNLSAALDDFDVEELRTSLGRVYLRYLARRPDSILAALRAIADSDGAVLVHCAAGKDRTGTVVAVALAAAGAPREQIVADYMATAERIDKIIARLAASPTYREELEGEDPAEHAPKLNTIEQVLDALDAEGGAGAWLTRHGFTEDELARLRSRLAPA